MLSITSFQRYRRLDPTKKRIAQTEFEHMMELGIVRQSDSKWASPLYMVTKSQSGGLVVRTVLLIPPPSLTDISCQKSMTVSHLFTG